MATNMYIEFENPAIAGTSAEPGHERELKVLSWSHGFVQPTRASAGADVEQATHQSLTFSKYLDTATNTLLRYCWSGKQFGKATLSCYRMDGAGGGKPTLYLQVIMEHVIIANYHVSGGPGDIPVENVSLNYGIIEYKYIPQTHSDALETHRSTSHNLNTRVIS